MLSAGYLSEAQMGFDIGFAVLLEETNRIVSQSVAHVALEAIGLLGQAADRSALNTLAYCWLRINVLSWHNASQPFVHVSQDLRIIISLVGDDAVAVGPRK
jgi:hypothetical protein